jgi:uncharacterized membrane protein YeaQ/YmgE (transglycosylase-associated protein family)
MEMIAYIIVGWATGLLCRFIVPNPQRMGLIRFLLIGMVGGLAGAGLGGTFFLQREPLTVGPPTLVGAFLGAAIAVFAVLGLSRNRAHV